MGSEAAKSSIQLVTSCPGANIATCSFLLLPASPRTFWSSKYISKAGNTKGGSITVPLTSCLVWNQLYDS